MTPTEIFLWGFTGSISFEILSFYQSYATIKKIPARYKLFGFWVVRVALAFMAAGLAVSFEAKTPLLAVFVGGGAPLILQFLARGAAIRVKGRAEGHGTQESNIQE